MSKDRENTLPASLIYERFVSLRMAEKYEGLDITALPNVSLIGAISGTRRQVDFLIDYKWCQIDFESRIIVDAKNRSRPVDVPDIEAFEGMLQDCRARRGIIVCTAGHTQPALRRAQDAISIEVIDFEEAVESFEWEYEPCLGPCTRTPRRGGRGGVLWGNFQPVFFESNLGWVIVETGKCDGCHSFHVWCWDCGEKFAVPDSKANRKVRVVTCGCEIREWASVPECELSGHVGEPTSIWLMAKEHGGHPTPIHRRPIR